MRIIAGSLKGRTLATPGPQSQNVRPTSDKVRGAIFNILGQWLEDLNVLDLYAGTGALAFEALSRGAAHAVLVDVSAEGLALCRQNAEGFKVQDRVEILPIPALRACEKLGRHKRVFELIFADPPYEKAPVPELLTAVLDNGLLGPRGVLVIEHSSQEPSPEQAGAGPTLTRYDHREFGDTAVSFYSLS
ncbi:MAG: 16S rRNA (guanine(966)-N(2))-methyltransferase RsmD [Myxococcota bacterium]|nr:16S rRNA (guanine(966)-N(2))-methyltransferase RsmD [Myxococcota bacterium]